MMEEKFVLVQPDEGVTTEEIKNALGDHFSAWGCAHEYDCCGCRSYTAHLVQELGHGYWRVLVSSSRNY